LPLAHTYDPELLAGFEVRSPKMMLPASMRDMDMTKYPARELPVSA
jgi:hypothetical protein